MKIQLAFCAATLLGAALLSPTRAQTPELIPPPQATFLGQTFPLQTLSRDEAAQSFLGFLELMRTPTLSAAPETGTMNRFLNSLSAKTRSQLGDGDFPLFLVMAAQWAGESSPAPLQLQVQNESDKEATLLAERIAKPQSKPLVLVQDAGNWGVDVVATYAEWNNLPKGATLELVRQSLETNPQNAVFLRARDNARRSSCQSNLKQIALGVIMYEQDHDEKLPPTRTWMEAIYPYLKTEQIFTCPSLKPGEKYGYAFNSGASGKNVAVFSNPAQTVLIYETSVLKRNAFGMGENRANRHLDGANFAYVDGHVKWSAKTQTPSFKLKP